MVPISIAYFYNFGHYINAVLLLRLDTPVDQRGPILFPALNAIQTFIADQTAQHLLPRAMELAKVIHPVISTWANQKGIPHELPILHAHIQAFSMALAEELQRGHYYRLIDKGNLSIDHLVEGASKGYPSSVVTLLDDHIKREINEASRCLACSLSTASGFHILRSVEIAIKAYVHAATGSLPPINRRNWGEYIELLKNAGASSDVIDVLRILKTKRNPLMHPRDTLDEPEAIDILCLCQTVTGALVKDIASRNLEVKFSASLALLPTI